MSLGLEFDKCCKNLLDDPELAVAQVKQLQHHLKTIVEAYDRAQSVEILKSIQGFQDLWVAVDDYRESIHDKD